MSNIQFSAFDRIATVTLDNPGKLNALTPDMLVELCTLCDRIELDESILCVLLTAAGDRFFCAGADINAWADFSPLEFSRYWVRSGHRVFDRLARLSKPTIAVLSGNAFGGGLELAAAATSASWRRTRRSLCLKARLGLSPAGLARSASCGFCRNPW